MSTELATLSNNWLDSTALAGYYNGGGGGTLGNIQSTQYQQYSGNSLYPYWHTVYVSSPAWPIKLALSEVERLRKAAKTDEKLKDILKKFTALIEVTVDFEEK